MFQVSTSRALGEGLSSHMASLPFSKPQRASLIRAVPTLVDSPEDALTGQQLSDDLSDYPIPKDIFQVPFEFEPTLSASLRVKGSLRNNIQFWHHIGAPSPILSIIRDGYKIPFEHYPPRIFSGIIGLHQHIQP